MRRVLGGAEVVVRDTQSERAMAAAGVDAVVAPDLAFGLESLGGPREAHLAVALGPDTGPGRFRSARGRLAPGDPTAAAAAVDGLARRLGGSVRFVGFRGARDLDFAAAVMDRCETPARCVTDHDEQVATVAKARALLTSRYHPAVVAVSNGTPTVVRSDATKLASLVEQVGVPMLRAVSEWDEVRSVELPEPRDQQRPRPSLALVDRAVEALVAAATRGGGPQR